MEEQKVTLRVKNMYCSNCEGVIEKSIKPISGVRFVKASYKNGTVLVSGSTLNEERIKKAVSDAGYTVADLTEDGEKGILKKYGLIAAITVLIALGYYLLQENGIFNMFPAASEEMDYIALFMVGLFTSVHCVSMCGGINLSVCMGMQHEAAGKKAALLPSLLYNLGRVISYTVVGGIVGGLGSAISFGGQARGIIALVAGIFMIIMGINMTGLFPYLRRFQIRIPNIINKNKNTKRNTPFVVGLLNGLMPCGPLQAMQIYALGTGSVITGALSMFVFSSGTVPLMFAVGALGSMLKKKYTDLVLKIGAILVIVLGFGMILTGLALSGIMI